MVPDLSQVFVQSESEYAPLTVVKGEEFTDTVTLGSLVVTNQGVGVAKTSEGFEGVDGILG